MSFIEPGSLANFEGRCLFYPMAGSDCSEFFELFADRIDEFHFADIHYQFDETLVPRLLDPSKYRRISHKLDGDRLADVEPITAERPYRFVKPAFLTEAYERTRDHRPFKVIRRRGFAQYALADFLDRSIGVFVHRGDSPGEGGSNVFFLGNKKRNYEPLSNLFNKLACKLSDHALVATDGSNVCPKFLRKFHRSEASGPDAFSELRERRFFYGNFDWTCVGYLEKRNGPTLVWDVTRKR
jgi:hypothetical protein